MRELVSNFLKHANATTLSVKIIFVDQVLSMTIWDNATTSDALIKEGTGINNVRRRVADLSGQIDIKHNNGFEAHISIPVPADTKLT